MPLSTIRPAACTPRCCGATSCLRAVYTRHDWRDWYLTEKRRGFSVRIRGQSTNADTASWETRAFVSYGPTPRLLPYQSDPTFISDTIRREHSPPISWVRQMISDLYARW